MNNLTLCTDASATFLGIFNPSFAPPLFYYSYIPIILFSLFFGFYILQHSYHYLTSKIFFALTVTFAFSIIAELIQWIAIPAGIVLFGWQITGLLQVLTTALLVWFVYSFLEDKNFSKEALYILFLPLLPVGILLATPFNTPTFDIVSCQAENGPLWLYIYGIQVIYLIFLLVYTYKKFKNSTGRKKLISLYLGLGALFLGIVQTGIYIYGDAVGSYTIYLIVPIGKAVFLTCITYLIVTFNKFNIRIIAAQVLLGAMWLLLVSMLFIRFIEYVRIVLAASLIVFSILSILLVNNIKKLDTQKRKIEELLGELRHTNKNLEHANEMKSKFLSIASHQFRSPVTALKGYAELILDGTYGEVRSEIKEPIERIFTSSHNLALIVNDFLNLSRIEQGRMEYHFVDHDIKDIITSILHEQAPLIDQRKSIHLSFVCDVQNSYKTLVDKNMIAQVFSNLIDNALKYTLRGTVEVSLIRDEEKKLITFKVKDSGVGISAESKEKLFKQFSRASNANTVNVMGTGLGLYIAKEIVITHGGKIWVESEGEGKGSQFYVEIPIKVL